MNLDLDLAGYRWLEIPLIVVVSVAAALLAHRLLIALLKRISARTGSIIGTILVGRLGQPARWLMVVLSLAAVQPSLGLPAQTSGIVLRVLGLLAPALLGWMVVALLDAINDITFARFDISVADNLQARRRRTRAGILHRITIFIVMAITFCLMLMSIPSVRTIGVTLVASAGLAAIAVGAAAQPALKNLIAGIQMAFTEPIRIDDVVIIAGEWGRIEDIRLTYVVVHVWDDRRLIVPVSKFLEESFENWTRDTSALLGTAFLHLDPTADVGRIRARLEAIVKDNHNWDGRVVGLQVTELHADHMELRALVSAADAGKAFDLRCDVREALMAWIVSEMPEALVRTRAEINASTPPQVGSPRIGPA